MKHKALWMGLGLLVAGGAALFNAPQADAMQMMSGSYIPAQIELKGEWQVTLQGDAQNYKANLPGTLDDAGIGKPLDKPEHGALSRKVRYIGPATYTREINIPESAKERELELYLERVMWQSQVKIDGKEIAGVQQSLATPHVHKLGKLTPGKHKIEITIDNGQIYNTGGNGHSYSESMQTIWNGVIGKFLIREVNPISNVRVDAPWPAKQVTITFNGPAGKYELTLDNSQLTSNDPFRQQKKIAYDAESAGSHTITLPLPDGDIQPWDEFNPKRYLLFLSGVYADGVQSNYYQMVGFRTLTREGNKIFINGRPLFLRGNLDNCHFPLTGYPATDKETWLKIFKISKDNGLNNIRFHTWCPPQAAFDAADELGVYLAPEAGLWIDGWMPNKDKTRKYVGLGKGDAKLDDFIKSEMTAINNLYGNSTSMTMFCFGNELGNSDFGLMGKWLEELKAKDNRRLYSASTARAISSADDYYVTHNYPGVGLVRERMYNHTNWDYEGQYGKTKVPTVAHEIGQWPVYPDFAEINKYTGVLRPLNLIGFREQAKEKGTLRFNKEFSFASGMQNYLMYKEEIESFMRTPSCAGIHLLGMQDYSGQGEALIGWINSFYEEKGPKFAADYRNFFAPTAVLAKFPKYGWTNDEMATIDFWIHHYGKEPIREPKIVITVKGMNGKSVEKFEDRLIGNIAPGTVKSGIKREINFGSNRFAPGRYVISAQAFDGDKALSGANTWPIWVFPVPNYAKSIPSDIVFTSDFNAAKEALSAGKKVILNANKLGTNKTFVRGDWTSVYWSTIWFAGQNKRSLGCWFDKTSPVFNTFGCEGYADWIWHTVTQGGRAFRLDGLPEGYRPTGMPVPDFHFNDRFGTLLELKVGKGKLFVSGYDLNAKRPESAQLKQNIIDYVSSAKFNPETEAKMEWFDYTFAPHQVKITPRETRFADASIYIEPALRATTTNKDLPYDAKLDRAELDDGCKYSVEGAYMWVEQSGAYWVMKKGSKVTLTFPSGETGRLFVRFRDPNRNDRSGKGVFEGRPFDVPKHQQNKNGAYWLELRVDREDSLDGKLEFTVEPTTGPNLMIDRFIYQKKALDS